MARDEAYQEAERRIEAARQEGATELDLRGMGLTELPEAIATLTQLQSLNLSGNQLTELPEAIATLTQLKSLYLSNNQLTELPETIGVLDKLETIQLWINQLESLPNEISRLYRLRELNLGGNYFAEIPSCVRSLRSLETLLIWGNQLSSIPFWVGELYLLKELSVHTNRLTYIPDSISNLQELRVLVLGWGTDNANSFDSVPECTRQLIKLEEINISESNITLVPDWISELGRLKKIFLTDNNIVDIPTSICQLQHLEILDLDGNPLIPDLAAAHRQGFVAVDQYLRARLEGELTLNEAKLILVGEGEVGKSCLLGALREDVWIEDRPTTHGIEIKPVLVNTPGSMTEITLNGWDFGGQRVYRPTHQLFFSPTAVYLVVWKPREGPQQGFVKEWITLIKHREPDAKVLVVATHGGPGQRQPDIDRQELIDLFGNDTVLGFHHIDSKESTGIAELREVIANIAATLPGMGRMVPTKWQQLRELLEESGKTHMPYDDVIALCEEHGLEGFAAELFVRVSHTLGYLIHYHYDETLKDIVILQPDWLAKAISYVLDDETTRQRNGLVEFDHLSRLWLHPPFEGETGYPQELHPIFLKLMERFDLSYKVVLDPAAPESSNTSLIAQLVPDTRPPQLPNWGEQPEEGDNQQVQICRIVDDRGQSANAEGLFYQLIVRLHKYSLGRDNYENSIHWQRGLMLDNDYNGRALLEHIGNDIKITVRAAYPERFLSYLTEEVKWLVESFWEGLKCNIMVPCIAPCGMDAPGQGLFEVQKLVESKKKKRPEFPCPVSGCDEWQNIDQLLNNTQGVYELELNREWFTKAVPYFKLLTGTLSLVLPVAASTTKLMLDDASYKGIQEELDLGQKSLEFGIKGSNVAVDWQTKRQSQDFEQGDAIRAQGSILRELHAFLNEKDPGFGGLVKVQNRRREFLWVHPDFVSEY